MVNGFISRAVYVGAWLAIGLYMLGAFYLANGDKHAPSELDNILYVALGIVGGSHIMPPIKSKATKAALAELEKQGANEPKS